MKAEDAEDKSLFSEELLIGQFDVHTWLELIVYCSGLVVGVGVLVLILLITVIILCCRKKKAKAKVVTEVKDDPEKHDIMVTKDEDKDSGNNSSDSLPGQDPERQSLIQPEPDNHQIEAAKPKFSSPVWLDEIQNNKIFNKQKSINTEEQETPRRSKKPPFPVRSISEIIDTESEGEQETAKVDSASPVSNASNNNGESKVEPSDSTDNIPVTALKRAQETDL